MVDCSTPVNPLNPCKTLVYVILSSLQIRKLQQGEFLFSVGYGKYESLELETSSPLQCVLFVFIKKIQH